MKVILCLALLCGIALCQSPFEGYWSDSEYGGTWYLCDGAGSVLYSAYSEVGLAIFRKSGNSAFGVWYEGGGEKQDCITGNIYIELNDAQDKLTGWWSCGSNGKHHDFEEERLFWSEPSIEQCAKLSTTGYMDGFYKLDEQVFHWNCMDFSEDTYEASYSYARTPGEYYEIRIPGYEEGVVFSSQIQSGFYEEVNQQGNSLTFKLFDGRIGNFWWVNDPYTDVNWEKYHDDGEKHGYQILTRDSSATWEECAQNDYIEGNYRSDPSSSNDSTQLAAGILALASLVLFFL